MANPDGTFTLAQSLLPTRVLVNGSWVPVDLTLERGADGSVRPHAGPAPLVLSGGGTGPLATSTSEDGRQMTVTYPGSLPAPTLDGPTASYGDVLPDVDLVVSATPTGGFSEVFVVKTTAAAANPALHDIALDVTTPGLTLTTNSQTSSLTATDTSTGTTQFQAPTPTMWDSTTPAGVTPPDPDSAPPVTNNPELSDATGPGTQADTATMPTTLSSAPSGAPADTTTVHVHPDLSLLNDPNATYPIYIDPYYAPYSIPKPLHWTWVQQGCPTASNYDSTSRDPGAGYNGYSGCVGIERTFYQMNTQPLAGATINSATLQTSVTYSAKGCPAAAYPFTLALSDGIVSNNSWNAQPALVSGYPSDTENVTHCQGQGALGVSFDVTRAIQAAAANSWTSATFRLTGNETDAYGWKRFSNNPALNVTYDRAPNTPTSLTTTPAPVNGFIGRANAVSGLTMRATVSSNVPSQSVRGMFSVTDTTTGNVVWTGASGFVSQSGTVSVQAPSSILAEGHSMSWSVYANDNILNSGSASVSAFTVDTTPPDVPAVSSGSFPASGTTATPTLHPGQTGTFHISSRDTNTTTGGPKRVDWQLNKPFATGSAPATVTNTSGSVATGGGHSAQGVSPAYMWGANDITVAPQFWGTNTLYVRVIDAAGNVSQNATYSFYAPMTKPTGTTPSGVYGHITHNQDDYDLVTVESGDHTDIGGTPIVCSHLRVSPVNAVDPAAPTTANDTTQNYVASTCDDAPANKHTWDKALIAHGGSWTGGNQVDDLIAAYQNGGVYAYSNNGAGFFGSASGQRAQIYRPNHSSCSPVATVTGVWSGLTAIAAPGDITGPTATPGGGTPVSLPDLVTIENGQLWLYQGIAGKGVTLCPNGSTDANGQPIPPNSPLQSTLPALSAQTLSHSSLLSPGYLPDTGSNGLHPALWVRDNDTGSITQIPSDGHQFDMNNAKTIVSSGYNAATYPTVTAVALRLPDNATATDNPALPDIYTTDVHGRLERHVLATSSVPASTTTMSDVGFTSTNTSLESQTDTPMTATDYVPITPLRVLDTRATGSLAGSVSTSVSVLGSVPATATAVAVNIAALHATQTSWIRMGDPLTGDETSNLSIPTGATVSGSAIVPVTNGAISAFYGAAATQSVDLIVDVTGYFAAPSAATDGSAGLQSLYKPMKSTRVCDTRKGPNSAAGCVAFGSGTVTLDLSLKGPNGDPSNNPSTGFTTDATAVAINITSVNPASSGVIQAWSADQSQPGTAISNPVANQVTSNFTIVQLPADGSGRITLAASMAGNFIVDVQGYYVADAPGASPTGATRYVALPAARVMRTDKNLNSSGSSAQLDVGDALTLNMAGINNANGVVVTPTTDNSNPGSARVCAAAMSIEAYNNAGGGFLSVRSGDDTLLPSTVSFTAGTSNVNTAIVRLDATGQLDLLNQSNDTTDALIDLAGYFTPVTGGTC